MVNPLMRESMLALFGGGTLCPPLFLQMARCKVNNGLSASFWNDHWNLGILKDLYPQLFSFDKKKCCSVNQFLSWDAS
jgi:hypothetical protein